MTNLFTNLSNLKLKYICALLVLVYAGVGNVWGTTGTLTLSSSNKFGTSSGSTKNDDQGNTWTCTCSGIQNSYQTTYSGQQFGTGKSPADAKFTCTIAGATITSVKATMATGAGGTYTIKVGGDTKYSGSLTTTATEYGGTSATGTGEIEIKITKGTKASYLGQIVVVYTTASCSANPTIGNASLNGSFNMTSTTSSIGVSSGTCSTGNAACDWTDYGFVWSDGANTTTPTVGGTNCNKVQVGTTGNGTSWTGSITPSGSTTPTTWTTGHTYYVRTYGKNSKAGAAFVEGSAWSFTPYSVTFKANGGTGSDKVQYVRGGVSTTLTSNSFTKTGYTFNGWNTDADGTSGTGYTNGQSVSLSANLTLYAKWSVKTTNITLNKNNSDASGSTAGSVNYTFGESTKDSYTEATRTGYTLNGYYTATSAGTKILNADGTIAGNSIVVSTVNYTDASGNWAYDNTSLTLYAQWTIKNYTVTWKVNNANYTTGGPTDNVNHGSKVTKLPTAPDPASYCGSKFMGWTDATDGAYVHGTSNLYTKASEFPNATTAQTFYAVFADYTTD